MVRETRSLAGAYGKLFKIFLFPDSIPGSILAVFDNTFKIG